MDGWDPWAPIGGLTPELRSVLTAPIKLGCYDGCGKKKNDRIFFMNLDYISITTN